MASCQACGTEINARDRFCRNCGAPVPTYVTDSVDTNRFDPAIASPADASSNLNNPLYLSPSASYPAHNSSQLYQTNSLIKRLFQRKLVWLAIFLLLSLFIGTGITVGARRAIRRMRAERYQRMEETRRSIDQSVQNSLGFVAGSISDTEYPDVHGVFVSSLISDDGPAALANIQAGDVLMELNNQAVRNSSELGQALRSLQSGSEVPLKLYRDGETIASRIKLADPSIAPFQQKIDLRDQGFLGVEHVSRRCCIPGTKKWGLEVRRIIDNSPADLGGLQLGDVITEFGGRVIRTSAEFNRRIRAAKPRTTSTVKFYRGNTEHVLELILGHRG